MRLEQNSKVWLKCKTLGMTLADHGNIYVDKLYQAWVKYKR